MNALEVTFYRGKSAPSRFAVSPDPTGSILPDPSDWEAQFSQMVHPRRAAAFEGAQLNRWMTSFAARGYSLCDC
jgi:hypothetical protein